MRLSISSFGPRQDRSLLRNDSACDAHPCRARQSPRAFQDCRRGIQVGRCRYCSVDCFFEAIRARLFAMSNRHVIEFPRNPRLSLGLVMLSKGYLTPEQLRIASNRSQLHGENLETSLIRLGIATEKQITAARSAQWGYPMLAREHIGHMVQPDIPWSLLQACSAVPLHYSRTAKRIVLGFVYHVEHSLLKSIEEMTGCRVEPCFITESEFVEQRECLMKVPNSREIVEIRDSPEKMACLLCQAALDIRAGEVELTECKGHMWVRLTAEDGVAHVVFCRESGADTRKPRIDFIFETTGSFG
jgi:hypothetical protein